MKKETSTKGKLLTPKRAEEVYGIEVGKIYNWIRHKKFSFFKPSKEILFWESDLMEFLEQHKVEKYDDLEK